MFLTKQKYLQLILVISVLCFLALSGCGLDANTVESPPDENTSAVCPDDSIIVDDVLLSSAINENNQPIAPTTTFSADTEEILAKFMVTDDLCCQTVTIEWRYLDEDTVLDMWVGQDGFPAYVTLSRPGDSFAKGQYRVTMWIGIRSVVSKTFSIV